MQIVGTIDSYLVDRATGLPAQPPTLSGDVIVDEGGNYLVTQGGYRIKWTAPISGFSFSQTKKSDDAYIELSENNTVATFKQLNNELPEPGYHWVSSDTDLNEIYGQKLYLEYEVYDGVRKEASGTVLDSDDLSILSGNPQGNLVASVYYPTYDRYYVMNGQNSVSMHQYHGYNAETMEREGTFANISGYSSTGKFLSLTYNENLPDRILGIYIREGTNTRLILRTLPFSGSQALVATLPTRPWVGLCYDSLRDVYYIYTNDSGGEIYQFDTDFLSSVKVADDIGTTFQDLAYDPANDRVLIGGSVSEVYWWDPANPTAPLVEVISSGVSNNGLGLDVARNRLLTTLPGTEVNLRHYLESGPPIPITDSMTTINDFSFGVMAGDGAAGGTPDPADYFKPSADGLVLEDHSPTIMDRSQLPVHNRIYQSDPTWFSQTPSAASYTFNEATTWMIAIDGESTPDTLQVWVGRNGVWASGDPIALTGGHSMSRSSPSTIPVGPLWLTAIARNKIGSGGLEAEYKVRARGADTTPFNYPVPTGYNQFT